MYVLFVWIIVLCYGDDFNQKKMVYTIIKHETSAMVKDRLALRNVYGIAGKFGGELNLAVWWSHFTTAKLKSAKFSSAHMYVWRYHTAPPN